MGSCCNSTIIAQILAKVEVKNLEEVNIHHRPTGLVTEERYMAITLPKLDDLPYRVQLAIPLPFENHSVGHNLSLLSFD